MKNLAALFIVFLWVNISSAAIFSPDDIEWATPMESTLYQGGTLTSGEYTVKAVQFPSPVQGVRDINRNIVPETDVDPSVLLEIYKNSVLLKEIVMTPQSDAYIDPEYEVRVSATGFTARNAREWVFEYYRPWATISIATRAHPELEVMITTDKTSYTSYGDQIIIAKVEVKNRGRAFARNVDVNINIGELKLRGGDIRQLRQYYYKMEKTSQSFEIVLVVPELLDQKSYTLSVDAKGYDVKELEYKASGTASITVSPQPHYFTINKGMRDRMYLKDTAIVTIKAANGGRYDVYNISIKDSMNENFELISNTTLQWFIPVLEPGEEWSTIYYIKPLETNLNGFTIPAAAAQFTVNNKPYSASSKTTNLVVNGPKIILNKKVNKPVVNISEDVTITVSINNVGNIPTKIEIEDLLPENAILVNGSMSLAPTFLEANTPREFSYIIRMNKEGKVELPAAVANYTDVEYSGTTPAPEKTPEQETTPAPAQITPGLDIVLAIIVLAITVLAIIMQLFASVLRRK